MIVANDVSCVRCLLFDWELMRGTRRPSREEATTPSLVRPAVAFLARTFLTLVSLSQEASSCAGDCEGEQASLHLPRFVLHAFLSRGTNSSS